jgi:leucyl/phenylalanyl-tRNA--protein transferase
MAAEAAIGYADCMIRATSRFPDPESADRHGLVAVSETIDAELLLDAYAHGIFPWSDNPVCWFSPDPRAVFVRERIRLPKKMGKAMRHHGLTVTFDRAFSDVMAACGAVHATKGTWITPSFLGAYGDLHRLGRAHSVEVWQKTTLVGGLYGVQLGGLFAGESMFFRVPNASKVAFCYLVEHLERLGVVLFDAQVINPFTLQLGAVLIRRSQYLQQLRQALVTPTPYDAEPWPADPPPLHR